MEKFPMTPRGYDALQAELRDLKDNQRPTVINQIAVAREHGDLKENAEYHAAKERQGFIEGRIQELEAKIGFADVIDPVKFAGSDTIKFGATVDLVDEDTEDESTYQLVGVDEADIEKGRVSLTAPIARALIGKSEGDSVEIQTPGGTKSYEVLTIKWV